MRISWRFDMRLHRAALLLVPLFVACSTASDPTTEGTLPTGPVDSGFTLGTNGLSFPNFGASPAGQLGVGEMTRMFGGKVCQGGTEAGCQLLPVAKKWMTQVNTAAKGGHC